MAEIAHMKLRRKMVRAKGIAAIHCPLNQPAAELRDVSSYILPTTLADFGMMVVATFCLLYWDFSVQPSLLSLPS